MKNKISNYHTTKLNKLFETIKNLQGKTQERIIRYAPSDKLDELLTFCDRDALRKEIRWSLNNLKAKISILQREGKLQVLSYKQLVLLKTIEPTAQQLNVESVSKEAVKSADEPSPQRHVQTQQSPQNESKQPDNQLSLSKIPERKLIICTEPRGEHKIVTWQDELWGFLNFWRGK